MGNFRFTRTFIFVAALIPWAQAFAGEPVLLRLNEMLDRRPVRVVTFAGEQGGEVSPARP